MRYFNFNPRLTKGPGGCGWNPPPLTFFFRSLQNAKESDLRYMGNLFYNLSCNFDEKNGGGEHLTWGRVTCQSQRVGAVVTTFFFIFCHFESPFWTISDTMKLKLTEHLLLLFSSCTNKRTNKQTNKQDKQTNKQTDKQTNKQTNKNGEILIFGTFIGQFYNFWFFVYFSRKIAILRLRHVLVIITT